MRFLWFSIFAVPLMAGTLSLNDLVDAAVEKDADLKAEREVMTQWMHQKDAARVWENPELSLTYGRVRPDGIDKQFSELGVWLVQPIEKMSLRSARQRLLDTKIIQTKALLAHKERQLRGDIRHKSYLYAVASMAAEKAQEAHALTQALYQKGEKRFSQGAMSKADLLKLHIEQERAQQEAESARIKQDMARATLALAARMDISEELEPMKLPKPENPSATLDLDTLPMMAYYKAVEEEHRAQKEVVEKSVIPGVKAGIGYQSMFDHQLVGASLSMPIPLWNRNEALIKNAQSRIQENSLREQVYRFETTQSFLRFRTQLTSLVALSASQEKLIGEASRMVTLAQKSYEEGYGTLLELIDARRILISYQREYLSTLEAYYGTLGEMEKICPPSKENL